MSSLSEVLKRQYDKLKIAHLGANAEFVPPACRSNFVCYGGASEAQYVIGQLIPRSAKRVLIVGVFGGRDYFFLKIRGTHELHAVDLQALPGYDNLRVANVECPLPYPEHYFDAILMGDVLEHLLDDHTALSGLKRVLKREGVLVLTVPFLHEAEPTHLRVHTRLSVVRLLACCGFTVGRVIERPGPGLWPTWINPLHHALNLILYLLTGKTIYAKVLGFLGRVEYRTGGLTIPWRRYSKRWGAVFECRPAAHAIDYVAMNRDAFCRTSGDRRTVESSSKPPD
jgi:SAM-dependent methyltransferase